MNLRHFLNVLIGCCAIGFLAGTLYAVAEGYISEFTYITAAICTLLIPYNLAKPLTDFVFRKDNDDEESFN